MHDGDGRLWTETEEGAAIARNIADVLDCALDEVRHGRIERACRILTSDILRERLAAAPKGLADPTVDVTRIVVARLHNRPPLFSAAEISLEALVRLWDDPGSCNGGPSCDGRGSPR